MLEQQRAELERLGYSIVEQSEYEVVGVRSKWYWDCFATNMTVVVFVRATGPLHAVHIQSQTEATIARAKQLDPFRLPVGFQHGRAVVPVYLADGLQPDAQYLCASEQPMRYGVQFFPAALDKTTGQAHYLRTTPIWGAVYFAKWRYLVQHLIEPHNAEDREPISKFGTVYGIVLLVLVLGMLLGLPLLFFLAAVLD